MNKPTVSLIMKRLIIYTILLFVSSQTLAKEITYKVPVIEPIHTSYISIIIKDKAFSKKFNITIDMGESEEQIEGAKVLQKILSEMKSKISILNYMAEIGYELVNTINLTKISDGDTSHLETYEFIFKKTIQL